MSDQGSNATILKTNGSVESVQRADPVLINQNAGALFKNTQYNQPAAVAALGVGVNDKAVLFSVANVIDPEIQTRDVTSKRLEDLSQFIDIKAKGRTQESGVANDSVRRQRLNELNIDAKYTTGSEFIETDFNGNETTIDETQETDFRRREDASINQPVSPIIPRYLQNKSYIIFYSKDLKIILPFFSNPTIEEKRSSNYSTFTQIGRDPVMNYMYTNLSDIKISFKLNYQHIANILNNEPTENAAKNFIFFGDTSKKSERSRFNITNLIKNVGLNIGFFSKYKSLLNSNSFTDNIQNVTKSSQDTKFIEDIYEQIKGKQNQNKEYYCQALTLMWLYTIRSWITSASQTSFSDIMKLFESKGRSDARFIILKHGPTFYYVPGVLLNYDIKETQGTAYDVATAMAKSFDITLSITANPNHYEYVMEGAANLESVADTRSLIRGLIF